ncbi:MAG: EAL domain-containing protein [Bacteroidales bacterium]
MISVLLVEDNDIDASIVLGRLQKFGRLSLHWVESRRACLEFLARQAVDAILLDLNLGDGSGESLIQDVLAAAGLAPVVILTSTDDDQRALAAVQAGCQDWLIKGRADGQLIWRTIAYAIERKVAQRERFRAEQAVRHREALANMVLDTAPEAMLVIDADGQIVRANLHAHSIFGYAAGELLGQEIEILLPDHFRDEHRRIRRRFMALQPQGLHKIPMEVAGRHSDGTAFPASVSLGVAALDAEMFVVVSVQDLTARKAAEAASRLHAEVFHHASEGIVVADANGIIVSVNPAFTRITGYEAAEVIGRNPRLLGSGRQGRDFYRAMWSTLHATGSWSGEIWNRNKWGVTYPEWLSISVVKGGDGRISHYVGIFLDISLMKRQEEALHRQAHHDALTGLPNRVLLADRMEQAIVQTRRGAKTMAVAYIDLDGFKPVNDHYGHHAGDALLVEVSRRMAVTLRGGDTVARLGGDEFVVLLQNLANTQECEVALKRLLAEISRPIPLDGIGPVEVTASIGVSLYPADDADPDTLLRHADQAMYLAKEMGRNRYCLYDPEFSRRGLARRGAEAEIWNALRAGQFVLFYQPKVNMRHGTLVGAEALIRWNHPERGLLSPAAFLPLIEDPELEAELGEWVIRTTLRQIAQWQAAGSAIPVSVNIAAGHLLRQDFADRLAVLLAELPEVASNMLQIEVIETAALEDVTQARQTLEACQRLGVGGALDDFGTGYSSLTYLRHLPIDTLKIDQSFIRDLDNNAEDLTIVKGVVILAAGLGRDVLAEGVEKVEHGEVLLSIGCELGQGYRIAPPLPPEHFLGWLRQWQPDPSWGKCN